MQNYILPVSAALFVFMLIFGCAGTTKEKTQEAATPKPEAIPTPSQEPASASNCIDHDGKDIFVADTLFVNGQDVEEKCTEENAVEEFYCENNKLKKEIRLCPTGYGCFFGRCIENTRKCEDSDGSNISGKGKVVSDGETFEDACTSLQNVKEYVCKGTKPEASIFQCPPRTTCRQGACVAFNVTCTDSDIGKNTTEAGTVKVDDGSGFINVSTDTCQNATALKEHYCSGIKEAFEFFACPCLNGACRTDTTCTDSDALTREVRGEVRVYADDNVTAVINADKCIDSKSVREFYCDKNVARSVTLGCSIISPLSYCNDGACIVPENG